MLKQNIEDVKTSLKRHPFPTDVIIETISECNLRCIMCPQKSLTRQRGAMSMEVFKKIIDEVAVENPSARIWVAIMGEATLLGDKIVDMVAYASGKGLAVHFNTNAVLLDESFIDKILKANPHDIIIGLDAMTTETYNNIRIGGNFSAVVKNVLHLLKMKSSETTLTMQFIEMKENCHETEMFKEYWLTQGAVVKLRPRLGWGAGVSADNLVVKEKDRFPCPWLMRTVSIHWSGKMAQCDGDYDGKYSPGDINVQTIKEVWNGELAKRRERHWNHDFSFECCKNCKDWQAGRSYFYYP